VTGTDGPRVMLLLPSQGGLPTADRGCEAYAVKASEVISLLALIVALGSAISSYVVWKLSGARLQVLLRPVTLVDNGTTRGTLNIIVTNVGRAATTIRYWHLASRSSTASIGPGQLWSKGPKTPLRLESHETVNWFVDYQEAREGLRRDHP
jgi:hypothetical protein